MYCNRVFVWILVVASGCNSQMPLLEPPSGFDRSFVVYDGLPPPKHVEISAPKTTQNVACPNIILLRQILDQTQEFRSQRFRLDRPFAFSGRIEVNGPDYAVGAVTLLLHPVGGESSNSRRSYGQGAFPILSKSELEFTIPFGGTVSEGEYSGVLKVFLHEVEYTGSPSDLKPVLKNGRYYDLQMGSFTVR